MKHWYLAAAVAALAAATFSKPAAAQSVRLIPAVAVGYIVAGGSSFPGGNAPPTGGTAILVTLRALYAMRLADPYLTAAPIVVTPYSLEAIGFIGALDGGLSWHPDSRAWSVGTGGTFAPSYARFCNLAWCLREGLFLYGVDLHSDGDFYRSEGGFRLKGTLSARALTGRPSAWFWPGLTAAEMAINHWSFLISGGLAGAF